MKSGIDKSKSSYISYFIDFFENIGGTENRCFMKFCDNGDFHMMKWIYYHGTIDIHMKNEYCFIKSCKNDFEEIVYWLYSIGNINIYAENFSSFIFACENGNLKLAKWFFSLDPTFGEITYLDREDMTAPRYAFRLCCASGKKEIVKWLCSENIEGSSDYIQKDSGYGFRRACWNGHLELAKWIYEKYRVNIHEYDNSAINHASKNKHADVVLWLKSIVAIETIEPINNNGWFSLPSSWT
jgi:hypothetical protein